MINKTLYNLQKNHEAKKIANGIVDFLEKRDKDVGFRNYLISNIPTLRKAMNEKKDSNETMEKLKVTYHENMEKKNKEIKEREERIAEVNKESFLAEEEEEEQKRDKQRERKRNKKKKRKKKKVIQKAARDYIEAQKIVYALTKYLKEKNKDTDFRDFILFNIDKVVKMKEKGLSPSKTWDELERLYIQRKNKEQEAIKNGRYLVLMEEIEKEIEEEQKEKRKRRRLERKQRKKTRENFIRLGEKYNIKIRL